MIISKEKPESSPLTLRLILLAIILTAASVPLLIYQGTLGRTPTLLSSQARRLLQNDSTAVLIDVRTPEEYAIRHIEGAQNWPLSRIRQVSSLADLPTRFKDKTLLLICTAGVRSGDGTRYLKTLQLNNIYSIRGGIQEWIAGLEAQPPRGCIFDLWKTGGGKTEESPYRQSPRLEQVMTVASGFGIKPAYTLLSLLLAIILWRRRDPDLSCLRWAMIFFFVGENFCALNYGLYNDSSYLFEYLHSLGMLLCFSFTTFALLEGLDRRILQFSDPVHRCGAIGLCGACTKYSDVSCGLKQTFYLVLPALTILAAMSLLVPYQLNSYNTDIFGTFYNYSHSFIYQVFESRCCPITAMILLAASFLILVTRIKSSVTAAKILFAAAMGFLGFGFFRTLLLGLYNQNMLWFVLWEEITELLFILGTCGVLWIFRKGLLRKLDLRV